MIEKIEILQHGEGSNLGSHSCKEARRFLCIVAYHHELSIKLREDSFDPLSEAFVGPRRWRPILLVQLVRDIKSNVGSLKQVQLHGSTQVALVSENRTVVVLPLHILQILQVMHIACSAMRSSPRPVHALCHPFPSGTCWHGHSGRPLQAWSRY